MRATRVSSDVYAEICNLYAYYNHCSDDGDAGGYVSCFAADGVLRIPGIDLELRGHAALREFKVNDASRRGTRVRRHWNSGIALERLDDGRVRGRCYLHGFNGEPGERPQLADIGRYVDTLVHEGGQWCFAFP